MTYITTFTNLLGKDYILYKVYCLRTTASAEML